MTDESGAVRAKAVRSASALRPLKLSQMVAERLRSRIIDGDLTPGSPLPAETEMLSFFGVSRPTLREALRILENEGLIEIGRGMRSGIVSGVGSEKAADYLSILMAAEGVTLGELHRARVFLEPEILRTLGELKKNERKSAIDDLSAIAEEMNARFECEDYKGVVDSTNDFHTRIAECAGNRPLTILARLFQMISAECWETSTPEASARTSLAVRQSVSAVADYRVLIGLLKADDFARAADFWREHMLRAQDILRRRKFGARRIAYKGEGAAHRS